MKRKKTHIILAFAFTLGILLLGYISFGFWTTLIFTSGFLGGFILWFFKSSTVSFGSIKIPYWTCLILFFVHRAEEKMMGFFAKLSLITGVPTPDIVSFPIIMLVLTSVGAWLSVPILVKRGHPFGYYLAWTFFAALGITELAHFLFPLFTNDPYGYFPGMASVIPMAPFAWYGMYRLVKKG